MTEPTHAQELNLKNRGLAALLSWLIPGVGQIYQGRHGKGILFFVCVMGLTAFGTYLGEWRPLYWGTEEHLQGGPQVRGAAGRLANFVGLGGACRLGIGSVTLPCAAQWFVRGKGELPVLGKFAAAPSVAELNELNARLNRTWEIAVLFTMVAGLLNVLVVWDAFEGPALHEPPSSEPQPEPAAPGVPA